MPRSKLAVVAGFLGVIGVLDVILGPVLIHAGVVSPMFGFQWLFGLGLLEGLLALVLGALALYTTRASSGRSGRGLALLGVACGALLVGVVALTSGPSSELPPINDITTDLVDPPAFTHDPADRDRDMSYPPEFVEDVRAAYSDLQTISVAASPAEALTRAESTARDLGWEVVEVDAAAGTLLARQSTAVFMFVDDVVVRVRPSEGGGATVDVRSKSRDGRGDLGANAERIRSFQAALPR